MFGEKFKEGLAPAEFSEAVKDSVRNLLILGGDAFIAISKTTRGEIPIGLCAMTMSQGQAWPHVFWFPEATIRGRLECTLKFLVALKEKVNVVIPSPSGDVAFFDHLCKYGVLRRIGTGRGWFGASDATLFETVRR